jgi:hypothetical protein
MRMENFTVPSTFYFCSVSGKRIPIENEKAIPISDIVISTKELMSIVIDVPSVSDSGIFISFIIITFQDNSNSSSNSISDWSTDEVIKWMKKLKLSKDYSSLIIENNINGLALKTMKDKEDWKEAGIIVFGDLRALTQAVRELCTQ